MREELEATGVDFSTRGARLDEQLDAMTTLWRDDPATHSGEFFRFESVRSFPRPVTVGGVPLHIGGHSPAAARRAGRIGRGFQPLGIAGDDLSARLDTMRLAAVAAGRDPDTIEVTLGAPTKSVDASTVDQLRVAGAHRVLLSTATSDFAQLEDELAGVADRLALSDGRSRI